MLKISILLYESYTKPKHPVCTFTVKEDVEHNSTKSIHNITSQRLYVMNVTYLTLQLTCGWLTIMCGPCKNVLTDPSLHVSLLTLLLSCVRWRQKGKFKKKKHTISMNLKSFSITQLLSNHIIRI